MSYAVPECSLCLQIQGHDAADFVVQQTYWPVAAAEERWFDEKKLTVLYFTLISNVHDDNILYSLLHTKYP